MASAFISGWPELPDSPLHSRVPEDGAGDGEAAALVVDVVVAADDGAVSWELPPPLWAQAAPDTARSMGTATAAARSTWFGVIPFVRAAMSSSA
jgi:hypothetical protein